jgi:hypothetical protein
VILILILTEFGDILELLSSGLSVLGIPSSLVNCNEAIHRITRHAQTGYIKVEIHTMEIYFP